MGFVNQMPSRLCLLRALFMPACMRLLAVLLLQVASWVRKYQDLTYDYCKLLTLSWARGLFYLFMGSALIAMWHILSSLVGLWMMVCGAICVYKHFDDPQPHEFVN